MKQAEGVILPPALCSLYANEMMAAIFLTTGKHGVYNAFKGNREGAIMVKMKRLDIGIMPDPLEQDIKQLIDAVNSGKQLVDCEMGEVLGDINQCESCKMIDSHTARSLREYYIRGGWVDGQTV